MLSLGLHITIGSTELFQLLPNVCESDEIKLKRKSNLNILCAIWPLQTGPLTSPVKTCVVI